MNKMNFNAFRKVGQMLAVGLLAMALVSCEKEEKNPDGRADQYFNVVYSGSASGRTATWVQALTLEEISNSESVITFIGKGFEVPSTRTARVYASTDGKELYNLDYGGGLLSKFDVYGGDDFRELSKRNMSYAIGTEYPRWTKINDAQGLIHTVTSAERVYEQDEEGDDTDVYLYTNSGCQLVEIELNDMGFDDVQGFDFPRSQEDKDQGLHIGRIDAPVVLGDKVYYGLFKSKYDAANDNNFSSSTFSYQSTALVLDYPSLDNATTISSTLSKGSTQGYRIPVSYVVDNSVYQLANSGQLLKITGGAYDNSYDFNLTTALGFKVGTCGWFYVGNGIGYALYYDAVIGSSSKYMAWGIARVDIKNKTAIDMNVPDNLSLGQYQMAKVGADGKLYMSITPIGGNGTPGNIYIFDSSKADKDGFALGAKLTSGAGGSYIGVF